MTQEAPSNDIRIATQSTGFYAGFNVWVAAVPKVVILALIAWVAASPSQAGQQLQSLQTWSTASFGSWYIYVTAFFTTTCLALALWPRTGQTRTGPARGQSRVLAIHLAIDDVWCRHRYRYAHLLYG
jgi:hypothetical protein